MVKKKEASVPVYTHEVESPVGRISLASDGTALIGLWIEGQKYFARTLEVEPEKQCVPVLERAARWLERYFAGEQPEIDFPLAPRGTAFQQEVWDMLCTIPSGELRTYGDLARMIAERRGTAKMSAQAVGGAVGHNPISIIIPCHRVVGSDGSLTGYAGGVSIKQRLLELEGAQMDGLYVPKKGTAL